MVSVRETQVPATTLQPLAEVASIDQPFSLGPEKDTDSRANAFRTASRFVKRWGLRWKIPISTYEHEDDVQVPFIAPSDILSHMIDKSPELLFGGYTKAEKIRELLSDFWCSYRAWHPTHEVFRHSSEGDLNWTFVIRCPS